MRVKRIKWPYNSKDSGTLGACFWETSLSAATLCRIESIYGPNAVQAMLCVLLMPSKKRARFVCIVIPQSWYLCCFPKEFALQNSSVSAIDKLRPLCWNKTKIIRLSDLLISCRFGEWVSELTNELCYKIWLDCGSGSTHTGSGQENSAPWPGG